MVFTLPEQAARRAANEQTVLPACLPVQQKIGLMRGGTAVLYTLDAAAPPSAGADEIISVRGEMVLHSAAIHLGEHGTVHELAESELYRWADATKFTALTYARPVWLNDRRCMARLRLENRRIGMEQTVIYTELGDGLARVDRLWRAIPSVRTDCGLPVFDQTAAYLASDATLPALA